MEEYAKVTPNEKQILEYLRKLEPFAHVDIRADEHGRPDVILVITQTKHILCGGEKKYLR